jgi:hypothetical protein
MSRGPLRMFREEKRVEEEGSAGALRRISSKPIDCRVAAIADFRRSRSGVPSTRTTWTALYGCRAFQRSIMRWNWFSFIWSGRWSSAAVAERTSLNVRESRPTFNTGIMSPRTHLQRRALRWHRAGRDSAVPSGLQPLNVSTQSRLAGLGYCQFIPSG